MLVDLLDVAKVLDEIRKHRGGSAVIAILVVLGLLLALAHYFELI
jgi:hypothetical protein